MKVQSILYILCFITLLSSCGMQENQGMPHTPKTKITKEIDNINQINTLDELATFNPSVLNDSKKGDPRFIELQKKQMLFGATLAQIEIKKEYQTIQVEKFAIYNAQEIWTPEIIALEKQIQELGRNQLSGNEEFNRLLKQKSDLMQELHSSENYKTYLQKKQSRIDSIDNELKKYWTPELIKLEGEIKDLKSEIYGTSLID